MHMTLKNSLGLSCEFLANGSIKSLNAEPVRISLKASTLFSKPGTNLYLRKKGKSVEFTALLGPESDSRFKVANDCFIPQGSGAGLAYTCTLRLSQKSLSWQWSVVIQNMSGQPVELDVTYMQ